MFALTGNSTSNFTRTLYYSTSSHKSLLNIPLETKAENPKATLVYAQYFRDNIYGSVVEKPKFMGRPPDNP